MNFMDVAPMVGVGGDNFTGMSNFSPGVAVEASLTRTASVTPRGNNGASRQGSVAGSSVTGTMS